MPIERLSFRNGVKIRRPDDLALIVGEHREEIVTLPPGRYDVTPKVWRNNLYNHFIDVFPIGTGSYEVIPKEDNVGLAEVTREGLGEYQSGKRVIMIPRDQDIAVIAGPPTKGQKGAKVYEVIFWVPECFSNRVIISNS